MIEGGAVGLLGGAAGLGGGLFGFVDASTSIFVLELGFFDHSESRDSSCCIFCIMLFLFSVI